MKFFCLFICLYFIANFIYSQKKDIVAYLTIFQKNEEKKIRSSDAQKIVFDNFINDKDKNLIESNAKEVEEGGDIHLKSYQMRIFETKNKKYIIAVFGMNCWTGCISDINELYFFDENMKDITQKILPKTKIITYFQKFVKKEVNIESAFLADILSDKSKITLYLSPNYLTMKEQELVDNVAFLEFDKKKGNFKFVEEKIKK